MPDKVLTDDLDNCLINFDRKVVVTNLLDEYGGLLEETAKAVNEYLVAEEAKGRKFLKTFLLRGLLPDSENEIITLVPEEKLQEQEEKLRDASSLLYSAETDGGSKAPPFEFVPLKSAGIKLDGLTVKDGSVHVPNGSASLAGEVKEEKKPTKKLGALGTMFKKQETAATTKKSPDKVSPKKAEPEKKSGTLGAMFKKQEAVAVKKAQESSDSTKKSPSTDKTEGSPDSNKPGPTSKKGIGSFLTKTDDSKPSVLKPPTPTKVNEFFKKEEALKVKEEPANVSANLFDESASSSDDEEALDALKSDILSDEDEGKPSTTNKRRRIIDSDDDDTGPEVKVGRKEDTEEGIEIEDDTPKSSETFMDEDGFVVTVKAKKKAVVIKRPNPTPVKVKKESPKSPAKKETGSKTPAAKKKQGNIMNFFTKK